jgi:hypothetical protein
MASLYAAVPDHSGEPALPHPDPSLHTLEPRNDNQSMAELPAHPRPESALSHEPTRPQMLRSQFSEDFSSTRGSTTYEGESTTSPIGPSSASSTPGRSNTLRKKRSLSRKGSMKRSDSRRSSYAGSIRSLVAAEKPNADEDDRMNSALYTPIPTQGNPTAVLADRFQGEFKSQI